jgi:hypothetical protein
VKRDWRGRHHVYDRISQKILPSDPVTHAQRSVQPGAGEIFLNDVDRDGTVCTHKLLPWQVSRRYPAPEPLTRRENRMTAEKKLAPPYPDPAQEEQDRIFVMKKLGFSEATFSEYMAAPQVPHTTVQSDGSGRDLPRCI